MIKEAIASLALVLLAAPSEPTPGYNTQVSTAVPPERFHGDAPAIVLFLSDVREFCGYPPPGFTIFACVRTAKDGTRVMALPNPCLFPDLPYAQLACHEMAHVNGWDGNHPL